jgi:UDP-N-acetyl-D-glucosamine dehydrogenase
MNSMFSEEAKRLDTRIADRSARVAVIGLGYVGLPLSMAICRAGFTVVGYDIDAGKAELLNNGKSYIDSVKSEHLKTQTANRRFHATADAKDLSNSDIAIICVPTPLTKQRDPDLSYVVRSTDLIAANMKSGSLVVLESTTYPGTTTEVVQPILHKAWGEHTTFFLGFSPEREDPGNRDFNTTSIPKIVAGEGAESSHLVGKFYGTVVDRVVPVSNTATAEAVKITENVFRAVNIALVNELKVIFAEMGIDVWDVINAAKTKPFGYQAFYPGPGLGGHCIPIDPFYLTWKAKEFDINTRFIELAGEVNSAMPRYVISRLSDSLGQHFNKSIAGSKILLIGLAYKKNVADMRESPTLKLMELLEKQGASVSYHDPHIPQILPTREHAEFTGRQSVALTAGSISDHNAIVIATDHDNVDYGLVVANAPLIVDTRNRLAGIQSGKAIVVKA